MPEHEDGYRELRHAIMGYIVSQAIFAVTEAGVPDLLADGPAEAGDLAERAGADADALVRFLRVLVAEGLFTEGPRGTFALTATGAYLRADRPGSLRHLVTLMVSRALPGMGPRRALAAHRRTGLRRAVRAAHVRVAARAPRRVGRLRHRPGGPGHRTDAAAGRTRLERCPHRRGRGRRHRRTAEDATGGQPAPARRAVRPAARGR